MSQQQTSVNEPGLSDLVELSKTAVHLRADALLAFTMVEIERIADETVRLAGRLTTLPLVITSKPGP